MFLILIVSIIMYIVATISIYHNIYNFEKTNKIKIIIIGYIAIFIITVIICSISSSNINTNFNYLKIAKTTAILIFSPINTIITLPYIGNILNKYKGKKINNIQLKKRFLILTIIVFIIIIFEIGYIKNFEMGLIKNAINNIK